MRIVVTGGSGKAGRWVVRDDRRGPGRVRPREMNPGADVRREVRVGITERAEARPAG
jgi:hypothetical protein